MTSNGKYLFCVSNMSKNINARFWKYTLPRGENKYQVCRLNFCDTLRVSRGTPQRLQRQMRNGVTFPHNMRGLHTENRPRRIPADVRNIVNQQILNLPTVQIHYSRGRIADPNALYLAPHLTVQNGYERLIAERGQNFISRASYFKMFTESPVMTSKGYTDECDLCCALDIKIREEIDPNRLAELNAQKDTHRELARVARAAMQNDMATSKIDPNLHVLVMDMQKVHLLN